VTSRILASVLEQLPPCVTRWGLACEHAFYNARRALPGPAWEKRMPYVDGEVAAPEEPGMSSEVAAADIQKYKVG